MSNKRIELIDVLRARPIRYFIKPWWYCWAVPLMILGCLVGLVAMAVASIGSGRRGRQHVIDWLEEHF